ncbi:hypothetical protein [Kiritimatiella glycovorans]|uniref:Uncharacterized protein n=1 Tax=Kiritimatiella glycovorans TaxID=1307763 RepID=A0A0G3EBV8_9BACT|nr:hypothetical protein [Kiritimatiella glycovorans]AKJ63788.1 hypothetical protein L21SP4_00516 [Kiritimatiella glycovorans]
MDPRARDALIDLRPYRVEAERVVLAIDEEFATEREVLNTPPVRNTLVQIMSRRLGRGVGVEIVADASGHGTEPAAEPVRDLMQDRSRWNNDPVVRRILESFNGHILEVRGWDKGGPSR